MGRASSKPQVNPLRDLPQVEAVLTSPELAETLQTYRRVVVLRLVREELDLRRGALKRYLAAGNPPPPGGPSASALAKAVRARLYELESTQLRPVINATGVLLHTNLGRSVLGARAREALLMAARGYCDLEMHMVTGKRSHRDDCVQPLLRTLTGAEAATVVNNCAAAVYLILYTLARRREVITSRGELVEIGGNFRIPDVVRASGCRLVEVGTTNRTRLADYAEAVTPRTALLLKTHQSNYRIRGFTEEAGLGELAGLAREHGIPLVFDAGSGELGGDGPLGAEPAVPDAIAAGADLVCFSGDKLLGGPQAGIICGSGVLISKLRKSPLWRALRVDKLTLAALGATLAEALRQPGRGMGGGMSLLHSQLGEQQARARQLVNTLAVACPAWRFGLVELEGAYGGGALPDQPVPGWAVTVQANHLDGPQLNDMLRSFVGEYSILGLLHRGVCCLHVAALLPGDAETIAAAFRQLLSHDRELTPDERDSLKKAEESAGRMKLG
jgi:L-seryl-tRNA(Ser) seleniumtransferase